MTKERDPVTIILLVFIGLLSIAAILIFGYLAKDLNIFNGFLFDSDPTPSQTPLHSPTPYVFQNNTIQLMWFSKPPTNDSLETVADNFDLFILTMKDENEQRELKSLGVNEPISQYFRLDAIQDPGGCELEPAGNQTAYKIGDFCWIRDNHPDWFLSNSSGNPIQDQGGYSQYVLMDPGNQGWREFFLKRIKESQQTRGWNGVFLDNVDASISRISKLNNGEAPRDYPTDESLQAAVAGFLQYLYEGYFQPEDRPLYANVVSNRNFKAWYTYLNYVDGAMDEGWAVGWTGRSLSAAKWEEHLQRAEDTQNMGKIALLVAPGLRDELVRQQFGLGSYLLINHGRAYFRYGNSDFYREVWLYPNYFFDLGEPLGIRYKEGEVWRRNFTKGDIAVNPYTFDVEINISE